MEKLLVEIVNDPLELEVDDVVIYSTTRELRTAKILKKPQPNNHGGMKQIRCMVNLEVNKATRRKWDRINQKTVEYEYDYNVQVFNLEEFNTVKYVVILRDQRILRVVK